MKTDRILHSEDAVRLQWRLPDLNRGHRHFQCRALPTELSRRRLFSLRRVLECVMTSQRVEGRAAHRICRYVAHFPQDDLRV